MISLAHHLGITPTIETVCTLDPVANRHLDWSGGIPTNKRPHLEERLDKDPSEITSPSHSCTNTFGGEPLPSPPSSSKKAYPHSWDEDEDDEDIVDINGSENGFDIDDYYINVDIFDEYQFLGMAEEFVFEMDIWSVPPCSYLADTDVQSFSPQNNIIFTCSSVVGSDMDIIDLHSPIPTVMIASSLHIREKNVPMTTSSHLTCGYSTRVHPPILLLIKMTSLSMWITHNRATRKPQMERHLF